MWMLLSLSRRIELLNEKIAGALRWALLAALIIGAVNALGRHRTPRNRSKPSRLHARIAPVKTLLKSLIVWLMLLAIPFQGVAAATMLICAPLQPTPHMAAAASPMRHDHHAMLAAAATGEHHHLGGKCAACATCCCGAAMAPSYASPLLAEVPHLDYLSSEPARIASVDLALPERPPQASLT